MNGIQDPIEVVDSIAGGVIGGLQFFPRAAENVANVASAYAGSINKNLNDFRASMPQEPAVVPRAVGSIVGETVGAVVGLVEAVVKAGTDTATDIKTQIKRGTGG